MIKEITLKREGNQTYQYKQESEGMKRNTGGLYQSSSDLRDVRSEASMYAETDDRANRSVI